MKHLTITHKLIALICAMALVVAWLTFNMVDRLSSTAYDTRRDMLQAQVESARSILEYYHQLELDGTLSTEEARANAFAAIGSIRFEPNGYIFGIQYDGVYLVHPIEAKVGTNQMTSPDVSPELRANTRSHVELATSGGGLNEYATSMPGGEPGKLYAKQSMILPFDPWNMLIGTGAYVNDIEAMIAREKRQTTILGAGAIALLMVVAMLFGATITRPLARVRAAIDSVAQDDTNYMIPYTTGTNETARIAKSTKALQDKVRERLALERQQAEDQAALEAERQKNHDLQKAEAERQAHVVATIRTALEAVADGDLTVRCADLGEADAELRAHFNSAIGKLESAMTEVTIKGADITATKDEIQRATMELSQRTERQAANLEETSAALEELSTTVRQTAEGAQDAARRVVSVSQETETSDAIVNDAVAAMDRIEQSSARIGNIIGVIEDIAFQTNLLTLNAGVEAARAGESGKGFAVVAQEVRDLAQRSSAAAKDVKDQIGESSTQVASGVRLVGDTGEALKRIFEQIKSARDIVSSIAESAMEQDTTLRSLAETINDMDTNTQRNAAMAEETTASTMALGSDTDALMALIHRFRVSGQATATMAPADNDFRMAG